MTRTFKFGAIAAAAFIAAPAFAAAALDANLELDTTYFTKNADRFQQGGRVEVNISGKKEVDGAYVASKGTAILNKAGVASVDDMWVEGGTSAFALKLGRFEAADLAPAGKDTLVVNSAVYNGNSLRGRRGVADPHATLTFNVAAGTSVELGVLEVNAADKKNQFGLRPVVTFGAGPATVKLGLEKQQGVSKAGFAGTVGLAVAGGTVNVNAAKRDKDTGFGLNGTFGPFGAGVVTGKVSDVKSTSVFAAYSVPFFIPDASLTLAVSNGKIGDAKDTGIRARVNYAF